MKSAKNLMIPFIILVFLGIGAVVFFAVDKGLKEPEDTSAGNKVDLLYLSHVDISSVNVLHRDGSLNVRVDIKNSAGGSSTYTYSGSDKETDSYSQGKMGEFVSYLTSFIGCVPVKENAVLSEFGLDNPAFTVTLTKNDGSSSVILIGDVSPDPEYCYVCAQGSSSVYLNSITQYKYASMTAKDFIDAKLFNISMSEIDSVSFNRKKDSLDLLANCRYNEETEGYSFKFVKPFEIASSDYFDRLIENICSLEADTYEEVTFDNLSKFGLSSPEFTIILKTKELKEHTIILSSERGGYYYGRLDGSGKIFKVEAAKIATIEAPLLVLISDYVYYDKCENIDSIECSAPEKKFSMKLDVEKGNAISDERSTVTLDGRNAKVSSSSGRSYAAMLYEAVFCINIGGVEENASISSSAIPVTTITIFDRNHSSVVYTFFKRNDDSYYVCKNGQYTKFYVYGKELYNDGGSDTYDYGLWPAYEILTKAITSQINGVYDIPAKQ